MGLVVWCLMPLSTIFQLYRGYIFRDLLYIITILKINYSVHHQVIVSIITLYLTLFTFSFEINESRLSDTRCCITTQVIKEWRDVARDVLCQTTLT